LQPDQRAVDEGKFAAVVEPGAPGLETGVYPVPGQGLGPAVAGGVASGGLVGRVPGLRLGEREDTAVLAGLPATASGASGARVPEYHPVRAQTADQLDRQVGQDVGERGDVVAGVHDDKDVRVTRLPVACLPEPADDFAELVRSHRCGV